ncbi:MAG: hypothetical protein AAFU61_15115 [Pseudomonadota bacterium]
MDKAAGGGGCGRARAAEFGRQIIETMTKNGAAAGMCGSAAKTRARRSATVDREATLR